METPGTILKREREAQGLTLRELSAIIRIPCRSLQYIEEDRYDLFPAEVFARGFLRNYARELQLSGEEVILSYNALRTQRGFSIKAEAPAGPSVASIAALSTSRVGGASLASTPARASAPPSAKSVMPKLSFAREGSASKSAPKVNKISKPTSSSASSGSPADSQRTFRFAYLIVFLVVATSLGLSVLFTDISEAEERPDRSRKANQEAPQSESPFVMPISTGLNSPGALPSATPTPAPTNLEMDNSTPQMLNE